MSWGTWSSASSTSWAGRLSRSSVGAHHSCPGLTPADGGRVAHTSAAAASAARSSTADVVDSLLEDRRGMRRRPDSGRPLPRSQRPPLSGPPPGHEGALLGLDGPAGTVPYSAPRARRNRLFRTLGLRAERGRPDRAPRRQRSCLALHVYFNEASPARTNTAALRPRARAGSLRSLHGAARYRRQSRWSRSW